MMKRISTKYNVRTASTNRSVVARLMIGAAVMLGFASAAMADPPANDDQSEPIVVTIGYNETIGTTEATTAFDDPDCYGQGPTVWYTFTPGETTFIGANTFGSNYDTTLSVYVEGDEGLVQIACNDDSSGLQSRVRFEAQENVTYLFMVASYASGFIENMTLTFNLIEAPPMVQIELALNSSGTVSARTGAVATLSGTVTCTGQTEVSIYGSLRQRAGRFYINGEGYNFFICDGTTPWSLDVAVINDGRLAGGQADVYVEAVSHGEYDEDYSFDYESATVRLNGSRR